MSAPDIDALIANKWKTGDLVVAEVLHLDPSDPFSQSHAVGAIAVRFVNGEHRYEVAASFYAPYVDVLMAIRAERDAALARVAELEAAEARVRRLHLQMPEEHLGDGYWCGAEDDMWSYPCATIRALAPRADAQP